MKEKTIFRIYPDGEVIALFPQIPADNRGNYCQSYMHVGQHGAADTYVVVQQTRLAKPKEYKALAKELREIGYKIEVAKKCAPKDRDIRRAASA